MGAEKRSRAEGASLLPQAVGGTGAPGTPAVGVMGWGCAKRLEPTRVTSAFSALLLPKGASSTVPDFNPANPAAQTEAPAPTQAEICPPSPAAFFVNPRTSSPK